MAKYHGSIARTFVLFLLIYHQFATSVAAVLPSFKAKSHPSRIIAKFSSGSPAFARASILKATSLSLQHEYKLVPGLVILCKSRVSLKSVGSDSDLDTAVIPEELSSAIARLTDSGLFDYVEPDYQQQIHGEPTDMRFTDQTLWGLRNLGSEGGVANADIDALRAWSISTGSDNVIVAVIDTGIRYTHHDLEEQIWKNPGEVAGNGIDDDGDGLVDNVFGIDAIRNIGDPFDENGHGTHIAGTIGASANDRYPHVGVAWNVRLMACKFLDADGFGFTSDAIRCIDFAVENGARILNASWGGGPFSQSLYDSIAVAGAAGALFVASAGNESADLDVFPSFPSAFQLGNVISVTALDRRDRLALFSSFGRLGVHLGAPGVEIFSSTASSDSSYATMNGTSMAAAHVSGVAALILGSKETMLIPELRARLLSGTFSLPSLLGKVETGGRLNAFRALTAAPDGNIDLGLTPVDGSELLANETIAIRVTVSDVWGITNAVIKARFEELGEELIFRNNRHSQDQGPQDFVYSCDLRLPQEPGPVTLSLEVSVPGKTLLLRSVRYIAVLPPPNDGFENATVVSPAGGILSGNNKFASVQSGEPVHAGVSSRSASVWWTWKPARSGYSIVDSAGSAFDTVLAVYSKNSDQSLREVAAIDDVGDKKQGYVTFDAEAGKPYAIAVAGFRAKDVGVIHLRIESEGEPDRAAPELSISSPLSGITITNATDSRAVVMGTAWDPAPNASGVSEVLVQVNGGIARPAFGTTNWFSTSVLGIGENVIRVNAVDSAGNVSKPRIVEILYRPRRSSNDLFASASELIGREGRAIVDSEGASREFLEPWHAGVEGGASVWWQFRPSSDGVLRLSTEGSDFDTTLAVYAGERVTNLTAIVSNDNVAPDVTHSKIERAVRSFQALRIAVDGHRGTGGVVNLSYLFEPNEVHHLEVNESVGGVTSVRSGDLARDSEVEIAAIPANGFRFDRWEGSIPSIENPLRFVITEDIMIHPEFLPVEFSDGFETGSFDRLEWRQIGNSPWLVQSEYTVSGSYSARSGIVPDGQLGSLVLLVNCRAGLGSFFLKVSSERDWDYLSFFVNDNRIARWSGNIDWQKFEFELFEGTNRLEWRYSKDVGGTSSGLDSAFIDNLLLPLVIKVDESAPARLALLREKNNRVRIDLKGQADQVYVIQSTEGFLGWKSISTNVALNGVVHFIDPQAGEYSKRFYRAVTP
ncbi:MAG: S8 family serine peptidase [Verrucomicrobia bacterium]|nr:S8 family serine peptidase [Verrucomicrobiota bacterium]